MHFVWPTHCPASPLQGHMTPTGVLEVFIVRVADSAAEAYLMCFQLMDNMTQLIYMILNADLLKTNI